MNRALTAVMRIWRAPRRKTTGQIAYAAYLAPFLALFMIAPFARVMWLVATDIQTAALFVELFDSQTVALVTIGVWTAALVGGRFRGPAVLHPFLAHVVTISPMTWGAVFGRSIVVKIVAATVVGTVLSLFFTLAWAALGIATVSAVLSVFIYGVLGSAVTVVCWLAGQTLNMRLLAVSVAILSAGFFVFDSPLRVIHPVGWVQAIVGVTSSPGGATALAVVTVSLLCYIPHLIRSLEPRTVMEQSLQWDRAVSQAALFEFAAVAETYQPLPSMGRRLFAIRDGLGIVGMIFIKDAIASCRTPVRLGAACVVILCSGGFAVSQMAVAPHLWLLAGASGLVAFLAADALTDGLRQVCTNTGTVALYGISLGRMFFAHSVFPLMSSALLTSFGAAAAVFVFGVSPIGFLGVLPFSMGVVGCQAMAALKPSMPVALLTPVPTPVGDLAILNRLAWSLDSPLAVFLFGVGVAQMLHALWLVIGLGLVIAVVLLRRCTRL